MQVTMHVKVSVIYDTVQKFNKIFDVSDKLLFDFSHYLMLH